jgi:hypothetical protein
MLSIFLADAEPARGCNNIKASIGFDDMAVNNRAAMQAAFCHLG